jgi:lipopolysaccharide export system permease protein
VAAAVVAVVGLRILGFAASGAAVRGAGGVAAVYAAPLGAILISLLLIFFGPQARARASAASAALAAALPARPRLGKA